MSDCSITAHVASAAIVWHCDFGENTQQIVCAQEVPALESNNKRAFGQVCKYFFIVLDVGGNEKHHRAWQ